MPLSLYRKQRDFNKTSEPLGKRNKSHITPIFVVQKHAASHLHYDFRIEMEGVLKSWSVPKGPPSDYKSKRLAIETEDHPLEYADFEGTIPEGEYGAGAVLIWDKGTFENATLKDDKLVPLVKAYKEGHFTLCLKGQKLKGAYTLQRIRSGKKPAWLFLKLRRNTD
jgi:DNA ligase D-like protein (predicted 3'-phosphoesterase)